MDYLYCRQERSDKASLLLACWYQSCFSVHWSVLNDVSFCDAFAWWWHGKSFILSKANIMVSCQDFIIISSWRDCIGHIYAFQFHTVQLFSPLRSRMSSCISQLTLFSVICAESIQPNLSTHSFEQKDIKSLPDFLNAKGIKSFEIFLPASIKLSLPSSLRLAPQKCKQPHYGKISDNLDIKKLWHSLASFFPSARVRKIFGREWLPYSYLEQHKCHRQQSQLAILHQFSGSHIADSASFALKSISGTCPRKPI